MNTKSPPRAGVLAGLLLLAVVILMTVAPTAGARLNEPSQSTASGVSVSQTKAQTPSAAMRAYRHGAGREVATTVGSGTSNAVQPPTSSGISSTTVWIAAAAILGALLIGTWALVSRRRKQTEATPDCESTLAGC